MDTSTPQPAGDLRADLAELAASWAAAGHDVRAMELRLLLDAHPERPTPGSVIEYRDALAQNQSAKVWDLDDFLDDMTDWASQHPEVSRSTSRVHTLVTPDASGRGYRCTGCTWTHSATVGLYEASYASHLARARRHDVPSAVIDAMERELRTTDLEGRALMASLARIAAPAHLTHELRESVTADLHSIGVDASTVGGHRILRTVLAIVERYANTPDRATEETTMPQPTRTTQPGAPS